MARFEEGQHALGTVAGPLGQESSVSLAAGERGMIFVHAIEYVA